MKAKDNLPLPVDKENLLGKDKIPISSEKNGFVGYLEVPRYPNDKIIQEIHGMNYQVYRIVENNGKEYFDSIFPLPASYIRQESPKRFLDILSLSSKKYRKLKEVSNRDTNNIVEIDKIESDLSHYILIRMKLVQGLPLVPEPSSIMPSDEACKASAKIYSAVLGERNKRIVQRLYDCFVNSNIEIIRDCGMYMSDIAPNNVLISFQQSDQEGYQLDMTVRFIDMLDLKKYRRPVMVDMVSLFTITRDRLPKAFIENLTDSALMMFPSLDDRNDRFRNYLWEKNISDFFNSINRDRYLKFDRREYEK